MPELPEVETIKLQLNRKLKGLTIKEIEILSKKNFLGEPGEAIGKKVLAVQRRGKIILIHLTGKRCLAIHLKLTGQLVYQSAGEEVRIIEEKGPFAVAQLPNKYTRIIIGFKSGSRLYFNDLRKFGWVKVLKIKDECINLTELEKLGPEAIDEKNFSLGYFKKVLAKTGRAIKLVIMDQEKLAGVGNIYANEALFLAKIRPDRPAKSLSPEEVKKLREAIIKVLLQAIEHKGTTDKDEAYRQITGQKGFHQDYLLAYGKDKQDCPGCKSKIKKIKIGGRGTFFCPKCQK